MAPSVKAFTPVAELTCHTCQQFLKLSYEMDALKSVEHNRFQAALFLYVWNVFGGELIGSLWFVGRLVRIYSRRTVTRREQCLDRAEDTDLNIQTQQLLLLC